MIHFCGYIYIYIRTWTKILPVLVQVEVLHHWRMIYNQLYYHRKHKFSWTFSFVHHQMKMLQHLLPFLFFQWDEGNKGRKREWRRLKLNDKEWYNSKKKIMLSNTCFCLYDDHGERCIRDTISSIDSNASFFYSQHALVSLKATTLWCWSRAQQATRVN